MKLAELFDEDVEIRRSAARHIHEACAEPASPVQRVHDALNDEDAEVRETIARALLRCGVHRGGFADAEQALMSLDPFPFLPEAAESWAEPKRFLVALIPSLLRAAAIPAAQTSALRALDEAARRTPNAALVEGVATLLPGLEPRAATRAARILWHAAAARVDLEVALPALHAAVTSDDPFVRYAASAALTRDALRRRDEATLTGLLAHEAIPVREGSAMALSEAAGRGADIAVAVNALAFSLLDDAGGVLHAAMSALRHAVDSGTDISDAVPDIEGALFNARGYPTEGWTSGRDIILASDLALEDPASDAAGVLAIHHLHRGDFGAIQRLMTLSPAADHGARRALARAPITDAALAGRLEDLLK